MMMFKIIGKPIYGKPVEIPMYGRVWGGIMSTEQLRDYAEYVLNNEGKFSERCNDRHCDADPHDSADEEFITYAKRLAAFVRSMLPSITIGDDQDVR